METGVETYFSDDRPQDYIVLAVGESREEVMAIRAELAAKKEEYEDSEQGATHNGP